MDYQVACACHKIHRVTTGDAGTSLTCSCGRMVEVPSLTVLRREAGEIGGSPELILESMLRDGDLPQHSYCVECHAVTDHIRFFSAICETPDLKKTIRGCSYIAYYLVFGLLASVIIRTIQTQTPEEEHGRRVKFRLPLRICHICDSKRTAADSMAVLSQVPVYAHLFKKYPHAIITAL